MQHARLPCPSLSPGVCSDSCPLSRWCHPTISSSVVPFSSHLQSFPVSASFQMSQLFTSGGQSIGTSASASSGGLDDKLCLTLATPWTIARQAPLSMGFSRQEYWSGLPFPSPIYLYIYKSSLEWMPTLFLSGCSSRPLPLSTKQTVPLCVIPLAVVLCL